MKVTIARLFFVSIEVAKFTEAIPLSSLKDFQRPELGLESRLQQMFSNSRIEVVRH